MPAAVPLIVQGASMVGGAIAGKMRSKSAEKGAIARGPEEQSALTGQQGAAGQLAQSGATLQQTGMETQAPATNYYSTLLRGNRAMQSQAVAAPAAGVRDVYSGAERNLERQGVRGAQRDVAAAELGRDRASKIAGLVTGVQPGAAAALTDIGQTQTGQGLGATASSGSIYSDLLQQGRTNRVQGQQVGREAGAATGQQVGGMIFDILSGTMKKRGAASGGGGILPSRPSTPPTGSWMPSGGGGF